jgi:hypothetical protein
MEQSKEGAGNEWLVRMRGLYSFTAVLETADVIALGPNVTHVSALEAAPVSRQGVLWFGIGLLKLASGLTLLELHTEVVLNLVRGLTEEVFDFNGIALF